MIDTTDSTSGSHESEAVRLVIISVPPLPLRERLEGLRVRLCAVGGSWEALRYPVHVTLRTGVLVPQGRLDAFLAEFSERTRFIPPLPLRLGRFVTDRLPSGAGQGAGGCFAGFEIEPRPDLLRGHERLAAIDLYRKGPQYPFHPHLTMAFDDLDEAGLERIRDFARGQGDLGTGLEWICHSAEFYRMEDGAWVPTGAAPLGGEQAP